jgi:hypothetical protein
MAASGERQRAAVQQAMTASIEQQRKSVRIQARGSVEQPEVAPDKFYTIPWPKPLQMEGGITAECDPLPATEIETLIADNARSEKLQPELLREIMRQESGFRPCAVSRVGAQGLMQLMPATAADFSVSDAFDPKQNVAAGAKFLKTLLTRYKGDVALALGAYNAGPARVDQAGGVPQIPETKDYVARILGAIVY